MADTAAPNSSMPITTGSTTDDIPSSTPEAVWGFSVGVDGGTVGSMLAAGPAAVVGNDGPSLDEDEGTLVGESVGTWLGCDADAEGWSLGRAGELDGSWVGRWVGSRVGRRVGGGVGSAVAHVAAIPLDCTPVAEV